MKTLKSYLCGSWQAGSGEGAPLHNPATGEVLATASTEGLDFGAALQYAREVGGPNLRALTFRERGERLKALAKLIHEAREELIEASIANAGTTRGDAKFDIDGASGTLAAYAHFAKSLPDTPFIVEDDGEQLTRSARFFGYHVKSPREGVAVQINAFNFPAWGLAEKAACALLAGMPIVTKPATSTALLAHDLIQKIVASEILPEGALQFVCGSAGDMLSHMGGQDCLAFTGGSATGVKLRAHPVVVEKNVRVNIEADSLNATILAADADEDGDLYQLFLRHVVLEVTQKSGQKCTATRRVLVPRDRIEKVQADIAEAFAEIRIGAPGLSEVRMGPLATMSQLQDARAGITQLQEAGARIVYGDPNRVDLIGADAEKGAFIGPVLLRADDAARIPAIHEREVFAPVTTLIPYDSNEEAIELVAKGEGSLVATLYSDDRATIAQTALGIAPYSGRVVVGGTKVAEQMTTPGMVLPSCIHGGPGRAGGGEELGGLRGLDFYMQRTAIQGDRGILERVLQKRS